MSSRPHYTSVLALLALASAVVCLASALEVPLPSPGTTAEAEVSELSVAAVPIDFSVSQIEIVESNGAFWASAKVCGGPGEVNVSFMVDGEVLESRVVLVEGDCTLVPFATPPLDPGSHEISISVGEDDNPVNNIVRTQLEVLPPTLTPEAAEEPCPEETEAPAIPALGAPSKATIAAFLAVLALLSAVLLSWFKLRSSKRVKRAPSDGERE